jgi:hypothetical protein
MLARGPGVLTALLPGALTVYLAFNEGGYYAGAVALAVMALLVAVSVRVLLASHPGNGFGRLAAVAVALLALFAMWVLASGGWSDSRGRALLEFDRALLYLLALLAFASVGGAAWRMSWTLRGIAAAAVIVCGVGLSTRLLPDLWPLDRPPLGTRLNYPLTYSNAFGFLAALGIVVCFGLTSRARESAIVRVLAAAALPLLGCALLLTLSRGAIAAGILGVVVFIVVGRPRALVSGLLAAAAPTAIAHATPVAAPTAIVDAWRLSVSRSRCRGTASATTAGPSSAVSGLVPST